MISKSRVIVSIIFLSVAFHACPSECCPKKFRAFLKRRGKEEKPAELVREEASFIKYSHASIDNYYIEILRNENKSIVVRELNHPPVSMNQVAGEEFLEKIMGSAEPEPDAEYINLNDTNADKSSVNESVEETTTLASSPLTELTELTERMGEDDEETTTEEPLSPEDATVRREWGGECLVVDWNRCNKIRRIVVLNVINNQFQQKDMRMECVKEPILCLRNGWTANRCHIMCMAAQCNKQLFFEWDNTVDFEGPCKYRK